MAKGCVPSGATGVLDSCRSSYCTVNSELLAHESHRLKQRPSCGCQEMSIYKLVEIHSPRILRVAIVSTAILACAAFVKLASAQVAGAPSSSASLELSRT